MLLNRLNIVSLGLITILMVAACDNSPTGGDDTTDYAVVRGKVDPSDTAKLTKAVEGTPVAYLARVQANGSLELASRDSVVVNADGTFELETQATNNEHLVVVVDYGQEEKKSTVNRPPRKEQPVYTKPTNNESTQESNIWVQVIAEGKTGEITYADIELMVDSTVAAQIHTGNVSIADVVLQFETTNTVRQDVLVNQWEVMTAADLDAALVAQTNAQADLDEALYNASTNAEIESAVQAQWNAHVQAYLDVGINANIYARADQVAQTCGEHAMNMMGHANTEARFRLKQRSRIMLANKVQSAVTTNFQMLNADSAQVSAAIQAGITLKSEINTAQSYQEVQAAFQAYHDAIVNALTVSFGLKGDLIASIDSSINGTTGLKAGLSSSLSVAASNQAIIEAYQAFYDGISALVENTLAAYGNAEITAVVNICILANLVS
ncbi:MAG: hypothetical protein K9M19_00550 [Candidatus Marinimicrobia bacterium]|nr:hypothetical protein [Candidatus Neomarinimicrobiota bacterium]